VSNVILYSALGLGNGALIAGLAIAIVVFYRGSGCINLATGAVAMITGFTFWKLRGGGGSVSNSGGFGAVAHTFSFATAPALLLTLVMCVLLGLMFEFVIFRPLRNAPPLAKLIGSLGVLLLSQSIIELLFGGGTETEPSILPNYTTVTVFHVAVPVIHFILTGIVLVAALLLAALYRWTSFGLATRAAAENEASAILAGLSPNMLSITNSILACLVAGMLGVLAAPVISLDTQNLPLLVVPALAAALFANYNSVMGACLVGLLIGAGESLLYWISTLSWFPQSAGGPLPGVQDVAIFLLILIAMYWRGARMPGRGDLIERRLPLAPRPERLLRPAVLAAVIGVAALILLPYDFRQSLMNSMIGTVLTLSLVILTGYVGQVSVMQLALS
jgi:branched-chain amino acid transport system permease protein